MQFASTTSAALRNALMAAATMLGAHAALAVDLVPGVFTALPGTSLAEQSFLSGTVLEDVMTPFSIPVDCGGGCGTFPPPIIATLTGTVQSQVVRESAAGTLDFYWRISSDANNAISIGIERFRLTNFLSTFYDANWRTDGPGNTPPTAAQLETPPLPDGTVTFSFGLFGGTGLESIGPGGESYFLLLHTDATQYASTARFALTANGLAFGDDSGTSQTYATFAPQLVPEPSTYVLTMLGLGLVGAMVRRRGGNS